MCSELLYEAKRIDVCILTGPFIIESKAIFVLIYSNSNCSVAGWGLFNEGWNVIIIDLDRIGIVFFADHLWSWYKKVVQVKKGGQGGTGAC